MTIQFNKETDMSKPTWPYVKILFLSVPFFNKMYLPALYQLYYHFHLIDQQNRKITPIESVLQLKVG